MGGIKGEGGKFGVDLLLPQVGGSARKTNKDYTGGQLPELLDVIIESGASLFVSAVGVPPKYAVDKFHEADILVMNMVGAVKHVDKALEAGVDIICAQGGEGGGHTGDVATSILIPKVVDLCRGMVSPLTGKSISVVAAGGIYDGRGLSMALSMGADAVWVGTRFVASQEAGATKLHKSSLVKADVDSTVRTLIYSGRPLRLYRTAYVDGWEKRQDEIKALCAQGILPHYKEEEERAKEGKDLPPSQTMEMLMGQCAGVMNDIKSADEIVSEMITQAISALRKSSGQIASL